MYIPASFDIMLLSYNVITRMLLNSELYHQNYGYYAW